MATGKTWLELTNAVLRRLREPTQTSVTATTYSTLIGDFVNEAKREVEDAWDWNRLRSTVTVTTIAGTFTYTLTGLSKRFRVIDAYNTSYHASMIQIGSVEMNRLFLLQTPQSGEPQYYNFNGQSSGDPNVDVYPVPIGVSTLKFNVLTPQDDFSSDSTQLLAPDWPVILGAWAKAVSERGEDGGANSSEVDVLYRNALADAVAQDAGMARDELIWNVQ